MNRKSFGIPSLMASHALVSLTGDIRQRNL
jgi:hypothetical protein